MRTPLLANRARRQFLCQAAAAGAAAFLPRTAFATWGDTPITSWPSALGQYKVLEIYLYGGLSPWETFYVREPMAMNRYRGFEPELAAMSWSACTGVPTPANKTEFFAMAKARFGSGAMNLHEVHLGPFTAPLWRTDLLSRMRVVVMQHDLEPHEAAIPYTMTGHRLGRPKFAGTGAAIQRRFRLTLPAQTTPFSYVCVPGAYNFPGDNILAASATGTHGGDARPLSLRIGNGSTELVSRLLRTNSTSQGDALLDVYRAEYRQRLRWQGMGDPLRSKGFAAYDASAASVLNASALHTMLNTPVFTLRQDVDCTGALAGMLDNMPGTAIRTAAHLLTRPTEGARYVCVIDSGLQEVSGGGGYDTHSNNHIRDTARNLWNTLSTLAEVIQDPTSAANPDKVSLDDTLVVLTTEFGRTPARNGNGRDHHTAGYVSVLIGGPITAATGGRAVAGNIVDATGVANPNHVYSATDLRAALLLAADVYPMNPDSFAIGDLTAALQGADEASTAAHVRERIFGIP